MGYQACCSSEDDEVGGYRCHSSDVFEAEVPKGSFSRGRTTNKVGEVCTPSVSGAILTRSRYQGYNTDLIDRFVAMGFELDRVVEAFNFVSIDRNNGEDYELEEAYMGDITARLLGEP